VSAESVPQGSTFWAVVRLVWVGLLASGIVVGLIVGRGLEYGSLGGLAGMALLETQLFGEGRSPILTKLRRAHS
jgi:hypothetical protein